MTFIPANVRGGDEIPLFFGIPFGSIFALVGGIGLGLNEVFLWLFTEMFAYHYLVSKLFSTGFVYLWNFAARKILLFR